MTSGTITLDGTQTFSKSNWNRFVCSIPGARPLNIETQSVETSVLSEFAPSGTWISVGTDAWSCAPAYGGGVAFKSPTFTEVEEWTAFFSEHPMKFVYPLATPVTYQLTAAQLATLSGYNAVSADTGTLSVEYRADTALTLGGD